MSFERTKAIEFFFNEISSGRMQFPEMRKHMEGQHVSPEEIKVIVSQVDDKLHHWERLKMQRAKGLELFIMGAFLTLGGMLVTVGTYIRLIDLGNLFIIAYGPILGGLLLMYAGRAKMRRR